MPATAPVHAGMTRLLRSMTRSEDRSESQKHKRSRIFVRDDDKGRKCSSYGLGTPTLDRVRRVGYGRHGGAAPATCERTDDVGLDSFAL